MSVTFTLNGSKKTISGQPGDNLQAVLQGMGIPSVRDSDGGEGFSGSDIRDVCQSAQLKLIGEFFETGKAMDKEAKPRLLTMGDFRSILEDRKPSVSMGMLSHYSRWFEAFKAL